MVTHDKDRAYDDFIALIRKSWTYDRIDAEETEWLLYSLKFTNDHCLSGSYQQRINTLQAVYVAFLAGLGYTGQTFWREP